MTSKFGVRGKLFLISVALIVVGVVSSGAYLESELRTLIEGQILSELQSLAQAAREACNTLPRSTKLAELDAIADRLGSATSVRITLLDQSGNIIGDSAMSLQQIARSDSQADRPEVQAASFHKVGQARRFSTTTGRETLYVAVNGSPAAPVVRAAMPLSVVDNAVWRLRVILLVASALGLFIALLMSGLASHFLGRALKTFVEQARLVAQGQSARMPVSSQDELGTLGQSLNRLSAELRATVETLVAERDQQSTVLQSMHEGVLALDGDLTIETANQAAVTLLGLERSPVGRHLLEVARIPALMELAEKAQDEEATSEFNVTTGGRRVVLGQGSPLRHSGGVVLVLRDVTEARANENMRRDLVANVSHELRTPVSIIRANSETLLAGALEQPQRARKFIEAIERNSVRLSSLISDLLDLSRIEAGRYRSVAELLHPYAIIEELSVGFAERANARSVKVHNEIPEELSVSSDRQALEQILLNLVDNAIKYTFEGGDVWIRATKQGAMVRFEVSDNGPGIEKVHRDRVFERFYRVDPGRSRELGGTGLGLSIVKHLVSMLGGTVAASPVEPHGTCFSFTVADLPNVAAAELDRSQRATDSNN